MIQAEWKPYTLRFRQLAGTSRGVYTLRKSWFVFVRDTKAPAVTGVGECAPLPGLSPELDGDFEGRLTAACAGMERALDRKAASLSALSASIRMGLETALLDLRCKGEKRFYENDFTHGRTGIPINGLIWMGPADFMRRQIREKIDAGFDCIKIKIGALSFQQELDLIKEIRESHPVESLQIRLDANGAFNPEKALDRLEALAPWGIHSVEQPIMAGQAEAMGEVCRQSPVPIALDEELIDIHRVEDKKALLETVRPRYLVLKPSLHGGFGGCGQWIDISEEAGVDWWVTSALESNIGLNAISQWVSTLGTPLHQGLGTGQLFDNNFPSPLSIHGGALWLDGADPWDLSLLSHG